jgi:hypothetical protein
MHPPDFRLTHKLSDRPECQGHGAQQGLKFRRGRVAFADQLRGSPRCLSSFHPTRPTHKKGDPKAAPEWVTPAGLGLWPLKWAAPQATAGSRGGGMPSIEGGSWQASAPPMGVQVWVNCVGSKLGPSSRPDLRADSHDHARIFPGRIVSGSLLAVGAAEKDDVAIAVSDDVRSRRNPPGFSRCPVG